MDETLLDRYVRNLPKDSILICVGVKDGGSVERLAALGAGLRIFALELDPERCERLRRRFRHRPGIEVENLALTNKSGALQFFRLSGARRGERASGPLDGAPGGRGTSEFPRLPAFTVTIARLVTLDGYCRERRLGEIALLRIDASRFASGILKGAASLLAERRIRAISLKELPIYPHGDPAALTELHRLVGAGSYRLAAIGDIAWRPDAGVEYRNPLYLPVEGGSSAAEKG